MSDTKELKFYPTGETSGAPVVVKVFPCVFCGEIEPQLESDGDEWYVRCINCLAMGPRWKQEPQRAVHWWNKPHEP